VTDAGADSETGADADTDRSAVSDDDAGSAVRSVDSTGDGIGPDPAPFVRGVRWLRTVPVTLALCLLLGWVYVLELTVVVTAGRPTATWWFVATTNPSPGWVLGPLSHTPADPTHLLGNLSLLVVFGGMTERRLGPRATVATLAMAGLGGTAGQLVSYWLAPSGTGATLGASAMALAATAFATTASLRGRATTGRWAGEVTWVWTALGVAILARRLVLDLAVSVPGVGRFGHLWGIIFGVGLALASPSRRDPESR
jgi:membrane associated rhomboid family serine protease